MGERQLAVENVSLQDAVGVCLDRGTLFDCPGLGQRVLHRHLWLCHFLKTGGVGVQAHSSEV